MSPDDWEPDEDRMQARRQWLKRLDDLAAELSAEGAGEPDEPVTQTLASPLLVDLGPCFNSREMEAAIQAQEDRITRLDRLGR